MRRFAISRLSRWAAQCRAVEPSASAAFTSAPCASRARTAAASCAFTASMSGARFASAARPGNAAQIAMTIASRAFMWPPVRPVYSIAGVQWVLWFSRAQPMRTGPEILAKLGVIFVCGIYSVQIAAAQSPAASAAAALNRYCTTCHNAQLKTGGVVIDPASLSRISADAEFWEKVDWKLRSRAMPPAGMPRPDESTYSSLTSLLETDLDRAAAAKPKVGELPPLHRLTRTEYKNAIRDLLGLESLPKEMDFDLLLPP